MMTTETYLSYGMGVESTAILFRWIYEPDTRPCELDQLTTISAQVGDEYADTKALVDTHVIPVLRHYNMRYVQVARRGHEEADGITVLEDSRQPTTTFWKGDYKLSDELKSAGTVPQFGGVHRCALKFKAFVIEQWFEENVRGNFKHAIGYNSEETKRIAKSEYANAERAAQRVKERIAFGFNSEERKRIERANEYSSMHREPFYPLMEWGWNRERCLEYIWSVTGVDWQKSACVYCPFNALKEDAIVRHLGHPDQVGEALLLEHLSLAMNPRGTLYSDKSLIEITQKAQNLRAIETYLQLLDAQEWGLYRVRRMYKMKGKADRCVELLARFPKQQAAHLALARKGTPEYLRGIPYVYIERRVKDVYPTREEYFTIAPTLVETKAAHGIDWFDNRWAPQQTGLFDCSMEVL